MTLALLPIANGLDRYFDLFGEGRLVSPQRARTWRTNCAGSLWSIVFSLPSGRISTIRPSAFSRTRIMATTLSIASSANGLADLQRQFVNGHNVS